MCDVVRDFRVHAARDVRAEQLSQKQSEHVAS